MYDDILCMHVGMLWINIGMLCMHVGILCMNVGMVCSMNAIDMLEILCMLNLTDLPLPHMTDVKHCTSRPPYERGLGMRLPRTQAPLLQKSRSFYRRSAC